ncbi:MAG: hypothetical protein GY861_26895 [bacterium]|nr:hypothetical protein [bacterium]
MILALTISCIGLIGIVGYVVYDNYVYSKTMETILERMADLEQIAHSMMEGIE